MVRLWDLSEGIIAFFGKRLQLFWNSLKTKAIWTKMIIVADSEFNFFSVTSKKFSPTSERGIFVYFSLNVEWPMWISIIVLLERLLKRDQTPKPKVTDFPREIESQFLLNLWFQDWREEKKAEFEITNKAKIWYSINVMGNRLRAYSNK